VDVHQIGSRHSPPPSVFSYCGESLYSDTDLNSLISTTKSIFLGEYFEDVSSGPPANSATEAMFNHDRESAVSTNLLVCPTPVPAATRQQYATIFNSLVFFQRRRAEKLPLHAGLSADFDTNSVNTGDGEFNASRHRKGADGCEDGEEPVGPEERLEGSLVRLFWSQSRLDSGKLDDIW
jgi:hypothetical protein